MYKISIPGLRDHRKLTDSIWFWNSILLVALPFIPLSVWCCGKLAVLAGGVFPDPA
jgi:hypothetical protein